MTNERPRSNPPAADVLALALRHARARKSLPPSGTMPIASSSTSLARSSSSIPPKSASGPRWPAVEGNRPKILLVCEDEPTAYAAASALRNVGSVLIARDAASAAAICEHEVPQLVVADAALPSGGIDLFRYLKHRAATARVPLVLLGGGGPSEVIAAINAGARFVIPKPIDPLALEARIKTALR